MGAMHGKWSELVSEIPGNVLPDGSTLLPHIIITLLAWKVYFVTGAEEQTSINKHTPSCSILNAEYCGSETVEYATNPSQRLAQVSMVAFTLQESTQRKRISNTVWSGGMHTLSDGSVPWYISRRKCGLA